MAALLQCMNIQKQNTTSTVIKIDKTRRTKKIYILQFSKSETMCFQNKYFVIIMLNNYRLLRCPLHVYCYYYVILLNLHNSPGVGHPR